MLLDVFQTQLATNEEQKKNSKKSKSGANNQYQPSQLGEYNYIHLVKQSTTKR